MNVKREVGGDCAECTKMCTTNVGRIYFHTIIAAVCNYAKMCIGRNRSKCAFCPRLVYNLIVYVAFLGIV